MRSPLQKNDALLADVSRALEAQRRRLWWLGQSGFLVVNERRAVLFDPYLSNSLTRKYASTDKPHVRITERVIAPEALGRLGVIDAITSSHNHTDHLDADTLLPLLDLNPGAKLIIPMANRDFVIERLGARYANCLVEMDAGISAEVAGIHFAGIAAAHNSVERDTEGRCKFLGYVMKWGGTVFYHSGDTLLHEGLASALRPLHVNFAMLPINGNKPERRIAGNLDGVQAAQLAKDIGAGMVIPCHFDMFEFNTASPDLFVAECSRLNQPCHVLQNGEGMDW